jgi:hypothetical protein
MGAVKVGYSELAGKPFDKKSCQQEKNGSFCGSIRRKFSRTFGSAATIQSGIKT